MFSSSEWRRGYYRIRGQSTISFNLRKSVGFFTSVSPEPKKHFTSPTQEKDLSSANRATQPLQDLSPTSQFLINHEGNVINYMFYNGADNVVEFNLISGLTIYATWVNANTIRFNNIPVGTHTLNAYLADTIHAVLSNSEAQTNITFNVERAVSPGYCGDAICNASLGETCNSCSVDCGSCPPAPTPPSGGGGGGGGGSSSGVRIESPVAQPIDAQNIPLELRKVLLSDDVQFVDVNNGENIILEIPDTGISYIVSFTINSEGIILNVLNGGYPLEQEAIIDVALDDNNVYLGVTEQSEGEAIIALGLDEEKFRTQVQRPTARTPFAYVLMAIILILAGVIIVLIILYSATGKKKNPASSFKVFGQSKTTNVFA